MVCVLLLKRTTIDFALPLINFTLSTVWLCFKRYCLLSMSTTNICSLDCCFFIRPLYVIDRVLDAFLLFEFWKWAFLERLMDKEPRKGSLSAVCMEKVSIFTFFLGLKLTTSLSLRISGSSGFSLESIL